MVDPDARHFPSLTSLTLRNPIYPKISNTLFVQLVGSLNFMCYTEL